MTIHMNHPNGVLSGKTVLVTGGTGSMGATFVRRALSGEAGMPRRIIVLSRDEAKQYHMRVSLLRRWAATDDILYRNFESILQFRLGDVRNYADVSSAAKQADIIIHAAALKQVPSCEYFPDQAVLTNCMGAANIVRAIEEHGLPVETVVGISTDKACEPVNAMGMTKALQERILIAANVLIPSTRFVCTRYGNVLSSRGSVVPLFQEQIRNGGPVTVTVPEMTRFLLTLDEAIDTVFAALRDALPGDIFVPDAMAASVINLAKAMIGDRDIAIECIGRRPGEKLHEIMVSDEEAPRALRRGDYYAIRPMLPELARADDTADEPALRDRLSSFDKVVDLEQTIALLRKNGTLPADARPRQRSLTIPS